jgi:hypothetical protein
MWIRLRMQAMASPETKEAALVYITMVRPGGGSCPAAGIFAAFEMARQSTAAKKIPIHRIGWWPHLLRA